MASHRSRGSGSSSSRTHSVIYRPPNFISRGISNIAAGLNTHKLWIDFILFGFASTVLLVDTANRLAQMPFYLTGVAREAEKLTVPLIQSIQFTRGKNHMPGVLKVEIQSEQRMQIYGASVKIDARFSGLRYLMYHWKALSFIAFSSAFWITSMLFAGATWIYLASGGLANEAEGLSDATSTKKEDEGDDETVKREQQPGMRGVYYTGGMAPYAQYDSYIKPEPIVEGELPTSGLMRIPEYRGESQSPQTVKQEEISEDEGGVDVKKEEILDDEEKAKKESEEEIVDDAKKEEAKILESTIIAPLSPVSGYKVGATTQSQLEGHQSPGEEISKTVQRRKSRPLSPDSGEEDDEYDHL
ncbi:Adipose-regulatory protein, Seipin [Ascosphaera apis ARSEF 7405]|uniref:Adipose-regulatory protein, Seipin n=1 Tax=Ascosphaera apis ARSEF 7405 TaxID=392613 RepID=A0A162IBM3_9EURO|nr:Adipose-regulatory protein, Seipin [Ascosphaera apis ARSEF 7405]